MEPFRLRPVILAAMVITCVVHGEEAAYPTEVDDPVVPNEYRQQRVNDPDWDRYR